MQVVDMLTNVSRKSYSNNSRLIMDFLLQVFSDA